MEIRVAPGARWHEHLLGLCRSLHPGAGNGAGSVPAEAARRGNAWIGLRDAVALYLRRDARRFGSPSLEDLEDLASAKALELLVRAESGEWRLEGRSGPELAGYLATVARNALSDMAKQSARFAPPAGAEDLDPEAENRPAARLAAPASDSPESIAMAREYIAALRGCLQALQQRALRVWFFRAFYDMTSQDIASHPDVGLSPPHVDVVVQRARAAIRTCLATKGLEPRDMPAGAFVELWQMMETLRPDVRPAIETGVDVP